MYATDPVVARYVLTPVMMEQLLALRRQAEHPVFLGFKGSRAYIGIHDGRALFEPSIASTTSVEAVEEIAELFGLAETVVRELEGRDLWRLAMKTTGSTQDENTDVAERPADSTVAVQQGIDEARVSYGLSLGFFFAALMSLAGVAIAVLAARALDREYGPSPLTPWFAEVPPTSLDSTIAEMALVLLPIGAVVGVLFAFFWLLRVRTVIIRPDAVLIARGLRPFPRRYSRPPYGRVVRLDTAIYVGKVGDDGLINPSASPMPRSEAEAKWVAAEMRRALRQIARQ